MLWPWQQSKQQTDLEKMLVKLESEQRDEETTFWKDSVKIRQELLTGSQEYQATRHRAGIFKDLEGHYG